MEEGQWLPKPEKQGYTFISRMQFTYKGTLINIAPEVYEPSEDSFLLAEVGLSEIQNSDGILEVGCGTGFISAVIQANTNASVIGIDINPHAARCAKENGVEVIRGDLLSSIKGRFDVVLFNPPYLPTGEEMERKEWLDVALDGGYDGRRIIYRFLEEVRNHLAHNGRVLMVISSLTGINEVRSKILSLNFAVEEIKQERYMFEQLTVLKATRGEIP